MIGDMPGDRLSPPRRIVFSRKGLDSAAGAGASPVVDGRPISLPIPAGRYPGGRRYASLGGARPALVAGLTRLAGDELCHLDPDIDPAALAERPPGWRGAFGQVGAAQGHLRNQGVGEGDLFLFFGRFRDASGVAGGWRWTGPVRHLLYGWLRVGAVLRDPATTPAWLAGHPHAAPGWPRGNTVYVAADRLGLPGAEHLPGAGVFARGAALSVAGGRCSDWAVPPWLERTRMSYRRADRFWPAPGRMDASGQWQEAVAPGSDEAIAWAGALIAAHADPVRVAQREAA